MELATLLIVIILGILSVFFSIVNNLRTKKTTLYNQALLSKIVKLETKLSLSLGSNFNNQEKQATLHHNSIVQQFNTSIAAQKNQLDTLYQQLGQIAQLNENKMENIRRTLHENIFKLQNENSKCLEDIRLTVEEKLQSTLEKRLGESFKIVSERLEMVYKGLGEMQNLASGVGDLKKVLTNVKTRGVWGEAQLDAILQQIMMPDQYASNVAVKFNSQDRVEYAIKLPGREDNSVVWLPIDAKFPLDDYHRLLEAQESGNLAEIDKHSKSLENSLKKCAKTIAEKYINSPNTTDFAIMFLPIEGLYAEALRRIGIIEFLQREYRIVITSPTTLCAILNSLQMGFKTIAIEKHSNHVWKVLESIKPEFSKFADLLSKTKTKLEQASQAISDAEIKTRSIQKRLDRAEKPALEKQDSDVVGFFTSEINNL
ncbi:MAG: DNA recombination protein RmuC [Candidatus Midichloria sp.]|nr:MAG: DNA recombination protein RmuC [Candidatus Midichloria sp.]